MTIFKKLLVSAAVLLNLTLQVGSAQNALARPVRHDPAPAYQVVQGINTAEAVRVNNITETGYVALCASYAVAGVLILISFWYFIQACRIKSPRKGHRATCLAKGLVVLIMGLLTPFCITALIFPHFGAEYDYAPQ
ncbi:MAG: hypothetical protein JSS83_28475 [Cyanobacteria bacterium SZAS LIN-3]|nr:hypothetical protein [Cyanobacteria bacterium SZAS LIN-3]